MSILGEQFFKMSNAIFCYDMRPTTLAVYCYLTCCAGSKGRCWPSMKTIAVCCGCGVTTARKGVDELEMRGFIRRVPTYAARRDGQSRQTNNTYYILDLPPLPLKPKTKIIEVIDGHDERSFAC